MAPKLVHPFGVQHIRSMLVKLQRWWENCSEIRNKLIGASACTALHDCILYPAQYL